MKLKQAFLFWMLLGVFLVTAQTKTESVTPFTIGETRIIRSKILNEKRTLNIYLPEAFQKDKAYPIVYLLDGSANEDFIHIAGLVQFFNMQFQMPDCIVVGIANIDRKRDFTFPTDLPDLKKEFPTTGSSDKFIAFLETELQPYINTTYKTNGTNYIIGQSLGGLVATEILLTKPQLFTHYLIVSPSLWWDNESLLQKAKTLLAEKRDTHTYVFMAVGAEEHPTMIKDAKELNAIFREANQPYLTIDFMELANENHASILHQSISEAFKKLFPIKK